MLQYVLMWAYLEHLNIIEFKTMLFLTNNVEILIIMSFATLVIIFFKANGHGPWMVLVLRKTDHKFM